MDHDKLTRQIRLFFLLAALAGTGTLLYSADMSTHVLGAKATQKLSAANDTVNAGYYAGTTLHAVDPDLAAGNIVISTTIFGFAGTCTSDANATAGDILASSTAYVNGVKLTGTIVKRTLGGTVRTYLTTTGAGTWRSPRRGSEEP